MSQNAVVKENVAPNLVRVALMRELECGNGCKHCNICTAKPPEEILTLAADPVGVSVGEWVEVELTSTNAIMAAMLIYFLPCVTLLLGYVLGDMAGLDVVSCLFCGALGLVAGFLPARLVNRSIQRRDEPEFTVLRRK